MISNINGRIPVVEVVVAIMRIVGGDGGGGSHILLGNKR